MVKRVTLKTDLNQPLLSMQDYQIKDNLCLQVIAGTLNQSEQHQYLIKDGLVYRRIDGKNKIRCYVPQAARLRVLRAFHDESTHIGAGKMVSKLKETLYWPHMRRCVEKYVKNCRACAIGKSHTGRQPGLYQLGQKANEPNEVWHIDHAGPLVRSKGCTHILVIVDEFSKFCQLIPVSRKTCQDTVKAIDTAFEKLDSPKRIVADRGTAFSFLQFKEFLDACGCNLHLIATGVPRGNGIVERLMRTIFNLMRSTLTDLNENTWADVLLEVQENINNTCSTTTNTTPSLLMLGSNKDLVATKRLLKNIPRNKINIDETLQNVKKRSQRNYKMTVDRINKKRKVAVLFNIGDKVLVENTQVPSRGKLGPRFQGSFVIKKVLKNNRYTISKGRKRERVAAHEQLRPWPRVNSQKL